MCALRLHLGAVLLVLLASHPARGFEPPDSIPTVYSTLIRVDGRDLAFNGYYELNAPYHKSLEPACCERYDFLYAGSYEGELEVYYKDVYNRLTGGLLVRTVSSWGSPREFAYPPDSLRRTDIEAGFSPPEPDTLFTFPTYIPLEEAQAVWNVVRGTNVIQRLTEHDGYRVGITKWYPGYPDSVGDWPAEWLIVASTQPVAPREAALLQLNWPLRVVSAGIPFVPEVVVHNFSDVPVDLRIRMLLHGGWGEFYEETWMLTAFPSESTRRVTFSPTTLTGAADAQVAFYLETADGSPWADAYPDNDSLSHSFRSSSLPVFRRVTPERPLGTFPRRGVPIDFDRDGRMDLFQCVAAPKLFHNLGDGVFADITNQVSVQLRSWPYAVYCADLTGDTDPDLLILNFRTRPMLLSGDGSGFFVEITEDAGLADIVGYYDAVIADLEDDGDLDIVFQSHMQESVMLNDGLGNFSNVTQTSGLSDPGQTESIEAGDLNGDSLLDLVFTNWDQRSKVFANLGDNRFQLVSGPWDFTYARHSLIMDWDGDGLQDIIFTRYTEATEIFRNLGHLSFERIPPGSTGLPRTWNISAGDLDHDGQPELACGYKILRREDGRWVDHSDHLNLSLGQFKKDAVDLPNPVFVDLDGDRDLDLYGQWHVFENMGLPAVTDVIPPSPPLQFRAIGLDNAIVLSWTQPPDPDTEGGLIRYSQQGYPSSPEDGLPIPNGQNGAIRGGPGTSQSYLQMSLSEGVTLYYSVFAFDHAGNLSEARHAEATPVSPSPENVRMWIEHSPSSSRSFVAWLVHSPDADSSQTLLDGNALDMSVVCAEAGLRRGSFQCPSPGDHHLRACVTRAGDTDCFDGAFTLAAIDADRGGHLSSPDGRVRLQLPAGAVPRDTTLTYVPEELLLPEQRRDQGQLGRFALRPALSLDKPVVLTYYYSAADLGAGQDPSRLYLSLVGGSALSCAVDPESLMVKAQASNLGLFAYALGNPGTSTIWDPDFLSLDPAGANPAGETSMFRVELRASERLRAVVYDVTGREVACLFDETFGPGVKHISWNGRTSRGTNSGAGVYFLRVWSDHRTLTANVVRIR